MRILLTVHQYFPEHSGGTEVVTREVAAGLRTAGHEVRIFTGHPGAAHLPDSARFDEYTFEGIPITRFHHANVNMGSNTNILRSEYYNAFFADYFRSFLQRFRPDLVHFFHLSRLSASAIDACVELRIPTLCTLTDFWSVCPTSQLRLPDGSICPGPTRHAVNCVKHVLINPHIPRRFRLLAKMPDAMMGLAVGAVQHGLLCAAAGIAAMRRAQRSPELVRRLNQVDRLLPVTQTIKNALISQGVTPSRLTVLRHGIDASHIGRTTDRGTLPALRLGFLGQIAEHKGCHVLIAAVRSLPASLPVTLTLHGKPDEFPTYHARLRQLAAGDPRITFSGPYDNTGVGAVLADLDAVVVPSLWYEVSPLVIYEAFAAGVPVIASNLGGMAEMVHHDRDGLLFEMGNSQAFAQAIALLATDRPRLRRLASNTRVAESIQDYVAALQGIYATLLGDARSA